jgi:hypothetical protein
MSGEVRLWLLPQGSGEGQVAPLVTPPFRV